MKIFVAMGFCSVCLASMVIAIIMQKEFTFWASLICLSIWLIGYDIISAIEARR
jgi:hypothetical protein